MTLADVALAATFSILLWWVTALFRPRFEGRERVVMQWSLTGKPNSWASPKVALAVTPTVGTLTLAGSAGFVAFGTPGPDRAEALLVMIPMGALLLAIHAGHMWFAARAGSVE